MNFQFSEEQEALREQVRRLFGLGPQQARSLLEADAGIDAGLWQQVVAMGLSAAATPEALGGLGLGALELCVIAEELGRGLAPIPYASSVLYASEALKLAGGEPAAIWLPRLARGEAIATLAFNEGRNGTWDASPSAMVTAGRLKGIKTPVGDAAVAQIAIVSASAPEDGDGYGWWLVELEGIPQTPLIAIDRVRKHASLHFDGVRAQRLGEPGQGASLASRLLDVAAVLTAFEQLGGAEAMLAMSVDYAKQRRAFGNVIGVNQGVKHRLADMYTKIQLARGHCYYGAWALSTNAAELPVAAAGARLAATDAFCFAAEEGIELHGGIGFTWDNDCSLYLRRSRLLSQLLGNRARWSDRLISALTHKVESGNKAVVDPPLAMDVENDAGASMSFQDSPEEARYRAEVRHWLAEHAPAFELPAHGEITEDQMMLKACGWQACKAVAGYVGIAWRKDVGGQGGTPLQQVIFSQEESRFRLATVPFAVGLGMCVPTLYTFLPPEAAQRYVRPAMRGEEIWCQLFSEPAAGSDLAGIRTRAVKQGDDWIINGQKVWTSFAHRSDFGLLLTRSDPTVAKHKGLTMFYIDMRAPGVEVRPIRTLLGDAEFNEVFFTDLHIPDSQRLGAVNDGWKVALTTLMHERMAIGRPADAPGVDELIALASETPDGLLGRQIDSSAVREAIARFYINDTGLDFIRLRAQTALSRGEAPGPEAAIGKLVMAKTRQDLGAFALDLMENAAIAETDDPRIKPFRHYYFWAPGLRIAGGTDEILRNIIAERVLGLPGDLRVDKDQAFNRLK